MTCEANDDPPTLAMIGAERWTRRNADRNGAEPCATFARIFMAFLRASRGSPGIPVSPSV